MWPILSCQWFQRSVSSFVGDFLSSTSLLVTIQSKNSRNGGKIDTHNGHIHGRSLSWFGKINTHNGHIHGRSLSWFGKINTHNGHIHGRSFYWFGKINDAIKIESDDQHQWPLPTSVKSRLLKFIRSMVKPI